MAFTLGIEELANPCNFFFGFGLRRRLALALAIALTALALALFPPIASPFRDGRIRPLLDKWVCLRQRVHSPLGSLPWLQLHMKRGPPLPNAHLPIVEEKVP